MHLQCNALHLQCIAYASLTWTSPLHDARWHGELFTKTPTGDGE